MIVFEVKDMTCNHCVSTITRALKSADLQARFTIDPARHLVMVESTGVEPNELLRAISEAGYTPQLKRPF